MSVPSPRNIIAVDGVTIQMDFTDASVNEEDRYNQNDNDGDYYPFSESLVHGTCG